jgi:hypothetical protein
VRTYPRLSKADPTDVLTPPGAGREHPLFTHSMPVGLMSGENPRFPSVPGGHDALKHDLDTMGVQHEETQGHYGAPERSFLIYGLPREHLMALGQKYGQEAVIHNEGGKREFIYTGGPNIGKMHPGLASFDHWAEGSEPPEDYYTKLPANGYIRLHFDFDHTDTAPVMPGAPMPAPLSAPPAATGSEGVPPHVAAEPEMSKHEAMYRLYLGLKKMAPDLVEVSRKAPFKHPLAYAWHDGHTDHHYLGHAPGGVLISTKLHKHDAPGAVKHPHTDGAIPNRDPSAHATNDQSAKAGVKTYAQYALPFGHIDQNAKAAGGSNLFHYDYNGKNPAVNKLVADHGFQTYYAGGKYGKPDLANRNYNTKHLMVYDPSPEAGSSFGDETYTDSWRKTHELAHALAYPELNKVYGEGRRIGKLGTHRTLNEALRAVHWEHMAAHKQRALNEQLGIHVPDETFNRELNTVMHDAVHRAVTGKFTEPSEEGFVPHSHAVPLETSLGLVREAARNLGLTGMNDLVKKSEGATSVSDIKKSLTTHEALHELHKGLVAQVADWEKQCLGLRKAELAKSKRLKKDDAGDGMAPTSDGMAMSENDRLDAYAKGELKFAKRECDGGAACKCEKCEGLEKYAKGEKGPTKPENDEWEGMKVQAQLDSKKPAAPIKKAGMILPGELSKPAEAGGGAGPSAPAPKPTELPDPPSLGKAAKPNGPTKPENDEWEGMKVQAQLDSKKPKTPVGAHPYRKTEVPAGASPDGVSAAGNKGVRPDDKKPKVQAEKSQAGAGGQVIKKAGLAPGAPPPPKTALPAAGGAPKLPGVKPAAGPKLPGMPKPGAAAAPKPPAMGAGTPQLKNELTKAVIPSARDQQQQAIKLPGVRASVGNTMDNMLAGGNKPLNPGQPLSIKPIASNPTVPVGVRPSATGGQAPSIKPKAATPMVERVAASLTPPPAGARPGASLPGAHLFQQPTAGKPAGK